MKKTVPRRALLHSNTLTWSWKEAGYATQPLHLWSEQDWSPAGLYITDWQLMEGVSGNTHVSLLLSLILSSGGGTGMRHERWSCSENQLCPDPERLKQHHRLVRVTAPLRLFAAASKASLVCLFSLSELCLQRWTLKRAQDKLCSVWNTQKLKITLKNGCFHSYS